MKRLLTIFLLPLLSAMAHAQLNDANSIYGLHWYGTSDLGQIGTVQPNPTDAENMAPGREMWSLEINHLDDDSPAGQSDVWNRPNYYNNYDLTNGNGGYSQAVTVGSGTAKNHSLIYRLQPNWGRNVPHSGDPYTTAMFAEDCKGAANWHRKFCRVWQIGNEVNIDAGIENNRWGGSAYDVAWQPTPEQYADAYLACRDKIHEITPEFASGFQNQIVLMQPVSPGNVIPGLRYMDGNEFLWRQIKRMNDTGNASKIDGFALHSYAEPGGANFGVDGYMEALREQLMIIDELGQGNKPVFVTEFNKHMPNSGEAAIGARFVQGAYQAMHNWNTGSGGLWPGQPNHNIVTACWFIFKNDTGTWKDYSLQYQKSFIGGTNPDTNPWYGFQAAASANYPAGSITGGGATVSSNTMWWQDNFTTLDQAAPLPHWKQEVSGGSITANGLGQVRFLGSTGTPSLTLRSAGYVFGNFRAELEFSIVNANQINGAAGEANFDLRIREGSEGYSLTFFTNASDVARRNRVILRRTNVWSQIGSFNALIPGNIANGDAFRVVVVTNGSSINYEIYKTAGTGASVSPVVTWNVSDSGQNTGWVRMGTYNMGEALVNNFAIGGPAWAGLGSEVGDWVVY